MMPTPALCAGPEARTLFTDLLVTGIWMNDSVDGSRVPLSWKIVLSGYVPEYLCDVGRLDDMGLSFAELLRRDHINARAQAADSAADFSRLIRDIRIQRGSEPKT